MAEPAAELTAPEPESERGVLQQSLDQTAPPENEQDDESVAMSRDQSIGSGKSSVQDAWYYASKNGKVGPVSLQELREKLSVVSAEDLNDVLVWRAGFSDWMPAWDVAELNAEPPPLPPPLPNGIARDRKSKAKKSKIRPELPSLAADDDTNDHLGGFASWRKQGKKDFESTKANQSNPIETISIALFIVLIVVVIGLFGAWAVFDFPSLETLSHWSSAKAECLKFAEKQKGATIFGSDRLGVVDSWMKRGKIVVEIGAFMNDGVTYSPRICVIGGGKIELV